MIKGNLYRNEERIDFEIPSEWSEVPLSMLEKMDKDDLDAVELFSILSGVELDTVKQCRAKEVSFVVSQVQTLFNYEELEKAEGYVESVTLGGVKYNIIDNIVSMPAGQWWDIKKTEQMYKDKPLESIRRLLSLLIIEDGKKYDYADVEAKYEALKDVDVLTAFKLRSFFLSSQVVSMIGSSLSSKSNTKVKRLLRGMTRLVLSTVVYLPFIVWLKIKALFLRFSGKKKR